MRLVLLEVAKLILVQTFLSLSHRSLLIKHLLVLDLIVEHLLVALLAVFFEPEHVLLDLLPERCLLHVGKIAFPQRLCLLQLLIDKFELHLHLEVLQLINCSVALVFVILLMLTLNPAINKVIAARNDRILD